MKNLSSVRGFTPLEILIIVVIMGTLTAIAVPTYRNYAQSVQMSKMAVHFVEAVEFAEKEYIKDKVEMLAGNGSTKPSTTAGWVELFIENCNVAPSGGQGFLPGNQGDSTTGAIGVSVTDDGATVVLARPLYQTLVPLIATISSSGSLVFLPET